MAIIRYKCTVCGLETRVIEGSGQDHVACNHREAEFEVVNEDEEAAAKAAAAAEPQQ